MRKPDRCGGVIDSSLSPELWEWWVTWVALTPPLTLDCHMWLFSQVEALWSTEEHLAASLGFSESPRRILWVENKRIHSNDIYTEQGMSLGYVQNSYAWMISAWTKCEPEKGQQRHACADFHSHLSNAITWCSPSEKFIIRTACLGMEEPRGVIHFQKL